MDPVEKTPSEQLKEDVKLSKRRNGTIVDLYSGEWVSKAKVGTVKVYIKTDPDLQLMIGHFSPWLMTDTFELVSDN